MPIPSFAEVGISAELSDADAVDEVEGRPEATALVVGVDRAGAVDTDAMEVVALAEEEEVVEEAEVMLK